MSNIYLQKSKFANEFKSFEEPLYLPDKPAPETPNSYKDDTTKNFGKRNQSHSKNRAKKRNRILIIITISLLVLTGLLTFFIFPRVFDIEVYVDFDKFNITSTSNNISVNSISLKIPFEIKIVNNLKITIKSKNYFAWKINNAEISVLLI